MEKSKQLIELHVKYQMNLVAPENIKNTLTEEVKEFTNYYYSKKFKDIVTPEKLKILSTETLEKFNLTENLIKMARNLFVVNQEIIKFENETLDKYISKSEFLKAADSAIGLKDIRNKFINFAVHSSAYARMMSSIILAAIKDFMMENPLTKNNPIGGAFLKIGGDLLNNLPGMQGNFEGKVNDFISQNLSGRIKQSETFIQSELDSDRAKEIMEEFWEFLSKIKLSETSGYVDPNSIDSLFSTIPGFYDHIKKSGFLERQIVENINSFYEKYSDTEISSFIEEMGITKEDLDRELAETFFPLIDSESFRNYYKSTIERRFSNFYNSDEVKSILDE
ncbi:MAG: hypothetical protein KDK36_08005 [Leptospiraceae bacterium]|nr:hypothetical protein [Leptospiraceae bacterium]